MTSCALARGLRGVAAAGVTVVVLATPLVAQQTGMLRGTVLEEGARTPVAGAQVSVVGGVARTLTDPLGRFVLPGLLPGRQAIAVRAMGHRPDTAEVTIAAGTAATIEMAVKAVLVQLGQVVVEGASRSAETVIQAPAAISQLSPDLQRDYGPTGMVPQALVRMPGVDAVQSGLNDWNVNARGFNTTNTRRVVVLLDGRDLALAFLGSQEWPGLSIPLEDLGKVEFIRGPGSALYGPNAFSGVLTLSSPSAREVAGTKLSLAGGGLGSMQGGARQAGVFGNGRFGYRLHAGYVRSDTWARSRTNIDDMAREYATAIDTARYPVRPPAPGYETIPLAGQRKDGAALAPGASFGDRAAVQRAYGGARLDYYADGGTATAEVGHSANENESMVTGAGRLQIGRATRPWGRLGWDSERFKFFAYYSGRHSADQLNLSSGANIVETSATLHTEMQYGRPVFGGRGRVVAGGSARSLHVDSEHTLLSAATDDRTDRFFAGYGQLEYDLVPKLRAIVAARVDAGNLFSNEFSPKAALVWSYAPKRALRLTMNRAFKTPVALEYFLSVPAAPPADFSGLESALRASPLGPALAGVPQGALFTNSAQVPILALGNPDLGVEHVTSWELGWKAQLAPGVFATADAYYSRLDGFVTELLPGVNPHYAPWTAPTTVDAQNRAIVESTVRDALTSAGQGFAAAALTRLADGSSAMVVSVGNSGRASEHGLEVGVTATRANGFEFDVNYSYSGFAVDAGSFGAASRIQPNTPRHKANVSVAYSDAKRLDLRLNARLVSGFDWAGGVFVGRVPSLQTIDAIAGFRVTALVRAQVTATNVFDQRRYQVFGGPLIGRRVLAGLTTTF